MSLKFYIGASGSGKTSRIEDDLTELAAADPDRQFILIVPDQSTLQAQKEMVLKNPNRGIMNIDVQSFGRLMHRIGDEVGYSSRLILDDTGKNLIIRKVAADISDSLPVIGKSFKRTGYVHEVKSVISEFEQYGISPSDMDGLLSVTSGKPYLNGKLKDIKLVYEKMRSFCEGKYITKEEKFDVLADGIKRSEKLKGAVVAFDGFTGFTPVQERVVYELMRKCSEVWMSIIMPAEEAESYRTDDDEHRLFSLSRKTIGAMEQLAKDAECDRIPDVYLQGSPVIRYKNRPALSALESGIFREHAVSYTDDPSAEVQLFVADDPAAEMREIFTRIAELTLEGGYAYRDIAVAVGSMDIYAPYLDELAAEFDIPIFADYSRKLYMTPFTEFLRSALETITCDFSYETVIHFLKSGMTGIDPDDISMLDNYLYATGIRGEKNYSRDFIRVPGYLKRRYPDDEDRVNAMKRINDIRKRFWDMLKPLIPVRKGKTASEITRAIYAYVTANECEKKLKAYAEEFAREGDIVRQKEYEQIYRYICELFEQIDSLLSDEVMDLKEYLEILKAGIEEIMIGVLPIDTDRVVIGDMQRTRFKPVKVLFAAGFNDGIIPGGNSSGGMISDLDREFLISSGFALSPTPRQQMYIQRLYIYHAMTRPSEKLILSYSSMDKTGGSLRPSYVLGVIKKILPGLSAAKASDRSGLDLIPGGRGSLSLISLLLCRYAAGLLSEDDRKLLNILVGEEKKNDSVLVNKLIENAFYSYASHPLSKKAVAMVYGREIACSISSLEKHAGCPYAHVLGFGMKLRERENSRFENVDMGTIYHEVLRIFFEKLAAEGKRISEISWEECEKILEEAVADAEGEFGAEIIFKDHRTSYQNRRLLRILKNSLKTLKRQLGNGRFVPYAAELPFEREIVTESGFKFKMRGRIDRVDTCDDGDKKLLKVTDYKSGKVQFDLPDLYMGLQLQLPVYLSEAKKAMEERFSGKEIVPAAYFYFSLKDPMIDCDKEGKGKTAEELETLKRMEMLPDGRFISEDGVPEALDTDAASSGVSENVKMKFKKDGSFASNAQVVSREEMDSILSFAEKKTDELAKDISDGNISIKPVEGACQYCSIREICRFEKKIPGFETVKKELKSDEAFKLICGKED